MAVAALLLPPLGIIVSESTGGEPGDRGGKGKLAAACMAPTAPPLIPTRGDT